MTETVYCLDSSALIDGLERFYPPEQFPRLWERMDELMEEGRLIVSDEVFVEVSKKDKAAADWCAERKEDVVVETDSEIANQVRDVLSDFPLLVKQMKGRNRADPFVIATAELYEAVVVTGEGNDGTEGRPKIPFVCANRDVRCIKFLELIQEENWSF